jgi:RimJ/RimL family protein N-acetyltransferase
MVPVLETARLILRPLAIDDAPALQELFPHWEIVRYLSTRVPWPYPEDGALQFVQNIALPAMERGEQWLWAIRLKGGPDHLIGVISLSTEREENRGFWLGQAWQGQGIVSEACAAVVDFWFNALEHEILRAAKAVQNTSSRRVSEREGGRPVAVVERDFVCGRLPAEIWELTREEWNARRGRL